MKYECSIEYFLTFCCFCFFKMVVVTRGYGSGLGLGDEPSDVELREFIMSEISRAILETTPVMLGLIKEGMVELIKERLMAFRAELAGGQFGACALTFREFRACGAPELFMKKEPISNRHYCTYRECLSDKLLPQEVKG